MGGRVLEPLPYFGVCKTSLHEAKHFLISNCDQSYKVLGTLSLIAKQRLEGTKIMAPPGMWG